jgi:hypothetical protein
MNVDCRAGLLLVLLTVLPAQAQDAASVESVTVSGTRERQVIDTFVKSLAAPAPLSGKITRWEDGVCPITVGLRPSATKFVSDRLRAVARDVGAPLGRTGCTPNIEIVFTTDPQGLMSTVRKVRPQLLGFAYTSEQMDKLARVTRPIQAWYTTQTRDLRGNVTMDVARHSGPGVEIPGGFTLADANEVAVTGEKLGDGTRSDFYHVIVAADPTKLTDHPVGVIADYIALVVLSHVVLPDVCQPLPSIANLGVASCTEVPDGLSANDLAFLRGLYGKMNPGRVASTQQGQIASQMETETAGR